MSASTIREVAEVLWRAEKEAQPHSVAYADTYDAEPSEYRRIVLTQAGAVLASPALDALVAERVAALAEDVWDALDVQHDKAAHIHASECCWSFPGATEAIAAALTERSGRHGADWSDSLPGEPPSCACGYNGTPEECVASRAALAERRSSDG